MLRTFCTCSLSYLLLCLILLQALIDALSWRSHDLRLFQTGSPNSIKLHLLVDFMSGCFPIVHYLPGFIMAFNYHVSQLAISS